MDPKLVALLRSRKFWGAVVGLLSALLVYFGQGTLDEEALVDAIVTVVGIFVGGVALEDGLSALGRAIMQFVALRSATNDD